MRCMSGERFTLDTNILVYRVDGRAGWKQQVADRIIELAVLADCWLTLQSLSEFYSAASRKGLMLPERAAETARIWLDLFPTATASEASVRTALAAASAGRASYWDALLVATAAEAGCTVVLTEDMADGSTLLNVRILNPFADSDLAPAARNLLASD
jgi:predicted nucleic acid-binding protein